MGTRTTKSNFLKTVAEEGPKVFSQLGFNHIRSATFWRKLAAVEHGFFLKPNATPTHFSVDVGATVPALHERLDYIASGGTSYKSLMVSRPLGLLRDSQQGERTFYHFATVEQLREVFPQVYVDFVEQAEPWLAGMLTVDDVANVFYKWRIALPLTGTARPPDPFAWAEYGWLLHAAGRREEAMPWLERALDQLKAPAFYTKGGHFVPVGTTGARPVPQTSEEARLIELLKKELEMGR